MKAISIKSVSSDMLESFIYSRTFTHTKVNTTAINSLLLAIACNSLTKKQINKNELTVSVTKLSAFLIDVLQVYTAYHKKDNSSIYNMLKNKNSYDIKTNDFLKNQLKKISAMRLINHTEHHYKVLRDFDNVVTDVDRKKMLITFHIDFVKLIKADSKIRKHLSALTAKKADDSKRL